LPHEKFAPCDASLTLVLIHGVPIEVTQLMVAFDQFMAVGCWSRSGSVIVDLSVDFSTSLNDTFITNSVMPKILRNLMALNNSVEIDGVKYSAAVDMIFEREVPRMNGSLISADNVTACTYVCMSVAALCVISW